MKAIRIIEPGKAEIFQAPVPERKEGEALLKILYGGICGSDLGSYRGTFAYFDYPRIPGHEFSAEIVEVDANPRGLRPGMIVTCNPYFNCGHCYSCRRGFVNACMNNETMGCQRDGAFCEYITMPVERIFDGKGLDPKVLAAIEPFCISYHGVQKANIKKEEKVLILGAGTIGVLAAAAAKSLGARVWLADVMEQKLLYARENFDIDGIILNDSPENFDRSIKEITGIFRAGGQTQANGFDVCIEAVGLPSTFQNCIDAAAYGGRVVLIGVGKKNLDFNFTALQKKELQVFGSRNALQEDFIRLIDIVRAGRIPLEKIITDIYPMEQAQKAFSDFNADNGRKLKVMLDFTK